MGKTIAKNKAQWEIMDSIRKLHANTLEGNGRNKEETAEAIVKQARRIEKLFGFIHNSWKF